MQQNILSNLWFRLTFPIAIKPLLNTVTFHEFSKMPVRTKTKLLHRKINNLNLKNSGL